MKKYPHLKFYEPPLALTPSLTTSNLDRVYEAVDTLSEVFNVDPIEILEDLASHMTENEFDSLRTEFLINSPQYDNSTFANHNGTFAEND